MALHVLSAGAAKALLRRVAQDSGIDMLAEFGAVGAMRERLDSGAPCDVIVLTQTMIAELAAAGIVAADSVVSLGCVRTGVAVPTGASGAVEADVASAASLKALLSAASQIYFPDPVRSTAGIHFMKVLTTLGLAQSHSDRFATFPNGATAMRAMADAGDPRAVGVTQCSEILYTDGVQLIGALPGEFELATVYSAAMVQRSFGANDADHARVFLAALSTPDGEALRHELGFEPTNE